MVTSYLRFAAGVCVLTAGLLMGGDAVAVPIPIPAVPPRRARTATSSIPRRDQPNREPGDTDTNQQHAPARPARIKSLAPRTPTTRERLSPRRRGSDRSPAGCRCGGAGCRCGGDAADVAAPAADRRRRRLPMWRRRFPTWRRRLRGGAVPDVAAPVPTSSAPVPDVAAPFPAWRRRFPTWRRRFPIWSRQLLTSSRFFRTCSPRPPVRSVPLTQLQCDLLSWFSSFLSIAGAQPVAVGLGGAAGAGCRQPGCLGGVPIAARRAVTLGVPLAGNVTTVATPGDHGHPPAQRPRQFVRHRCPGWLLAPNSASPTGVQPFFRDVCELDAFTDGAGRCRSARRRRASDRSSRVRVGYRQAKASFVLQAAGIARFTGPGTVRCRPWGHWLS